MNELSSVWRRYSCPGLSLIVRGGAGRVNISTTEVQVRAFVVLTGMALGFSCEEPITSPLMPWLSHNTAFAGVVPPSGRDSSHRLVQAKQVLNVLRSGRLYTLRVSS